ARNGQVISTLCVHPDDHVLMISTGGDQRIRVTDISEVGRNTQGVRVMRLDEGDKLASVARIPGVRRRDGSAHGVAAGSGVAGTARAV
ncbi:MAG: DNA gyrase C-terminal beta-propeller domain-containing protein, partial [Paludibaculum sp.]